MQGASEGGKSVLGRELEGVCNGRGDHVGKKFEGEQKVEASKG